MQHMCILISMCLSLCLFDFTMYYTQVREERQELHRQCNMNVESTTFYHEFCEKYNESPPLWPILQLSITKTLDRPCLYLLLCTIVFRLCYYPLQNFYRTSQFYYDKYRLSYK